MIPPAVPAALHPVVAAFLADEARVRAVLGEYGSPVHLVFPQVFADNVGALGQVLKRHRPYRIAYAHKVNQAMSFARVAAAHGLGLDVASVHELRAGLTAGFAPTMIEATGPKGGAALRELYAAGVTINVDNLWELETVSRIAAAGAEVPVLLRVSGFPGSAPSRFGFDVTHIDAALDLIVGAAGRIQLLGFAFHLDTGSVDERARAIDVCLALTERAYHRALTPTVINIGGGLRQVFAADASAYDAYNAALRAGLRGEGPSLAWGAATFGYTATGDGGSPVFHKYANTDPAPDLLAQLLAAPLPGHGDRSIGAVLADNLLELWLEPGKALVDQAGITLTTVEFVKRTARGATLVHLDISRDTVTAADQEVLIDPIVFSSGPPTGPVGVFFAGQLCLERDLVTQRQVRVGRLPEPGDPVVFANTAAYHMDLSAAQAAQYPVAPKVTVTQHDQRFVTVRDAEYRPDESEAR